MQRTTADKNTTPLTRTRPHYTAAAAVGSYRRAIAEEPWNPIPHGNLGNALSELGLVALQECIDEYHTAVMLTLARLDEDNAARTINARLASEYLVNLALVMLHAPATIRQHHPRLPSKLNRVDEALAALRHAMYLMPDDEAIRFMYVGLCCGRW